MKVAVLFSGGKDSTMALYNAFNTIIKEHPLRKSYHNELKHWGLTLSGGDKWESVLYVLERFMDRDIPKGEQGLVLSFGPGFSAQRIRQTAPRRPRQTR